MTTRALTLLLACRVQMLALPTPTEEELAALREEVALVEAALQLCDVLPCMGDAVGCSSSPDKGRGQAQGSAGAMAAAGSEQRQAKQHSAQVAAAAAAAPPPSAEQGGGRPSEAAAAAAAAPVALGNPPAAAVAQEPAAALVSQMVLGRPAGAAWAQGVPVEEGDPPAGLLASWGKGSGGAGDQAAGEGLGQEAGKQAGKPLAQQNTAAAAAAADPAALPPAASTAPAPAASPPRPPPAAAPATAPAEAGPGSVGWAGHRAAPLPHHGCPASTTGAAAAAAAERRGGGQGPKHGAEDDVYTFHPATSSSSLDSEQELLRLQGRSRGRRWQPVQVGRQEHDPKQRQQHQQLQQQQSSRSASVVQQFSRKRRGGAGHEAGQEAESRHVPSGKQPCQQQQQAAGEPFAPAEDPQFLPTQEAAFLLADMSAGRGQQQPGGQQAGQPDRTLQAATGHNAKEPASPEAGGIACAAFITAQQMLTSSQQQRELQHRGAAAAEQHSSGSLAIAAAAGAGAGLEGEQAATLVAALSPAGRAGRPEPLEQQQQPAEGDQQIAVEREAGPPLSDGHLRPGSVRDLFTPAALPAGAGGTACAAVASAATAAAPPARAAAAAAGAGGARSGPPTSSSRPAPWVLVASGAGPEERAKLAELQRRLGGVVIEQDVSA